MSVPKENNFTVNISSKEEKQRALYLANVPTGILLKWLQKIDTSQMYELKRVTTILCEDNDPYFQTKTKKDYNQMLAFFDATAYQPRCSWQGKPNATFMDGFPAKSKANKAKK